MVELSIFFGKPTNSQIEALDLYETDMNKYQNKVQDVIENELPAINDMIIKDGKDKIKITTREEFFEEKD